MGAHPLQCISHATYQRAFAEPLLDVSARPFWSGIYVGGGSKIRRSDFTEYVVLTM